MSARKPIIKFLVLLVALYAVFMIRWPGLEQLYGRVFSACANFASYQMWGNGPMFGTRAIVQVKHAPLENDPDHDVQIQAANKEHLQSIDDVYKVRTSSRHLGYMPTVVLMALILVTPTAWPRRLWSLLVGLILIHAFIMIRFIVALLGIFHSDARHGLFKFGPVGSKLMTVLVDILTTVPATAYVAPLFIWILVSFRGDDTKLLITNEKPQP